MRSRRLVVLAGFFALGAAAQYQPTQPLSETDVLFSRARSAVSVSLSKQPDFTCVETIERSQRQPKRGKFELRDNVRLEVALVNGHELYAWPGAPKFEERSLREMVGGTIGTGDFATHARNLFLTDIAQFRYQGRETINGHDAHKFHFRVPLDRSTFQMRVGVSEGPVGYQGHVWNDASTFELIRIDFEIDQIPPGMPLAAGHKQIDYARVNIGGTLYTLPSSTEMTLAHVDGTENRNRMVFSGCRQYTGESTLILEEPAPVRAPAPNTPAIEITLPADLQVPLKLVTPIDLGKVAIGESSTWEVTAGVHRQGREIIPKGARVELRIDHFGCTRYPVAYCFLGLLPGRIEYDNKAGEFSAELEQPDMQESLTNMLRGVNERERVPLPEMGNVNRGAGVLILRGSRPHLASGWLTTWRTLEVRGK
jgi:hypothetical protein